MLFYSLFCGILLAESQNAQSNNARSVKSWENVPDYEIMQMISNVYNIYDLMNYIFIIAIVITILVFLLLATYCTCSMITLFRKGKTTEIQYNTYQPNPQYQNAYPPNQYKDTYIPNP